MTNSKVAAMRRGMTIARNLIICIEECDPDETTLEVDVVAIADKIEWALDRDADARRGVLLALADYLAAAVLGGAPDTESWEPCRRPDGSSMLVRPVRN